VHVDFVLLQLSMNTTIQCYTEKNQESILGLGLTVLTWTNKATIYNKVFCHQLNMFGKNILAVFGVICEDKLQHGGSAVFSVFKLVCV